MSVERKRILFVDDEPAILASFGNLLRRDRHRWEVVFALGGAQALRELDNQTFDLVISDLRMPEVDGAALLDAVKQRSPGTVRIMLSGQAEPETVLQAMPSVHQFIAKPCDAKTLRSVIERCGEQTRLPAEKTLAGRIGCLPCLPSPAPIYRAMLRLADSPHATIEQMIAVVERDPALAAKVLQIANSAYFGTGQSITSISIAGSTLGLDVLKQLATSTMMALPANSLCELMINELQQQAVKTARHARRIVSYRALADEAYTAALLHDIGRLVLAVELETKYREVVERTQRTEELLCAVERELLGATHPAVGAHLLGIWALPTRLVDVVARHHEPRSIEPLLAATQIACSA